MRQAHRLLAAALGVALCFVITGCQNGGLYTHTVKGMDVVDTVVVKKVGGGYYEAGVRLMEPVDRGVVCAGAAAYTGTVKAAEVVDDGIAHVGGGYYEAAVRIFEAVEKGLIKVLH